MSIVHQLLTLKRTVTDSQVLLQHQSRLVQEAFAEALHHWTDPLGQRFVASHLEPQTRLLGPTREALEVLSRALEAAAHQGEQAEGLLMQARLAGHDVQLAAAAAVRVGARARQLASLARDRAHNAEACARTIASGLNALGTPPM